MTYTCSSPPYWAVNAMERPSGENLPNNLRPGPEVRRVAVPPCVPAVHKSPAYVKTIRSCHRLGNRSSFVPAADVPTAHEAAEKKSSAAAAQTAGMIRIDDSGGFS